MKTDPHDPIRIAALMASVVLSLSLGACGGGESTAAVVDSAVATEGAVATGGDTRTALSDRSTRRLPTPTPVAAPSPAPAPAAVLPVSVEGRLLASNCFQCHGTGGTGGFESIRGSEAKEVLEYLTQTANRDIMAAHAQGYTRAQLLQIIAYLQQ